MGENKIIAAVSGKIAESINSKSKTITGVNNAGNGSDTKTTAVTRTISGQKPASTVKPASSGESNLTQAQKQNPREKPHSLELDNHRLLRVSGVVAVPVFTDKTITVELDGETLNVAGRDLSVKTLDVENGNLNVEGYVTGLKYTQSQTPQSLLKRIFK